jgi:hypothetical protein
MKKRALSSMVPTVICLVVCWAAVVQHRQLTLLQARERELIGQPSGESAQPPTQTPDPGAATQSAVSATAAVPSELLRLRNEISQLNRRARELEGVRAENQRLTAQLGSRQAGSTTGPALPAGYIRKSQAQKVGYNTPEDAFQTFLWALANRDVNTLYESLVPGSSQQLASTVEKQGADKFFDEAGKLPGAAITDKQTLPDGSIKLMIQILPEATSVPMTAEQINGQWKISMPH